MIVDGGHNPASATVVKETIEEAFPHDRLTMVIGMLSEKLIDDVLEIWGGPDGTVDRFIVTAPAGTERAAEPERLVETLEPAASRGRRGRGRRAEAVDHAIATSGEQDIVLIFGSFYTVSEAQEPHHGGEVMERTLVLVKPDGVRRGLVGEVIGRIERKGLKLVAGRFFTIDDELAGQHYAEHTEKPFFGDLVDSSPEVRSWRSRSRVRTR